MKGGLLTPLHDEGQSSNNTLRKRRREPDETPRASNPKASGEIYKLKLRTLRSQTQKSDSAYPRRHRLTRTTERRQPATDPNLPGADLETPWRSSFHSTKYLDGWEGKGKTEQTTKRERRGVSLRRPRARRTAVGADRSSLEKRKVVAFCFKREKTSGKQYINKIQCQKTSGIFFVLHFL